MRDRRVLVCCFVASLVVAAVSQSASASEPKLAEENLDVSDTSFSRVLANAMHSNKARDSHYKATASSSGAVKPAAYIKEDENKKESFPFDVYGPAKADPRAPKPTLGEW
jgi:hypothetical protein